MRHIPAVAASLLLACSSASGASVSAGTPPPAIAPVAAAEQPTLVLLITIDQMRADYYDVFAQHLTGGLHRIFGGGAVFTNAFHDHGNTETAPGHASLLSGRFPRSTGIVANAAGVNDPNSPLIDSRVEGASPFRFRGTVLADWMRAKDPQTRLLSVSRKDRGAILPLGKIKDEVFWYASGAFTTSRYYADTLPDWVNAFNARQLPRHYAGQWWELALPESAYPQPDSVPVEAGGRNFLFPHPFPPDSLRAALSLPAYPMMDDVTLQFALAGINARGLGDTPGRTDLLAVSLSSTDAVGHAYGPDSREIQDQIIRLDQYLGAFLDSLYKLRDSSRVVIVLSSDHGVAPYPHAEVKSRFRTSPGGFAYLWPIIGAVYNGLLAAGVDSSALRWEGESIYLDPELLRRRRVNPDSVARLLVYNLAKVDGVLWSRLYRDVMRANPDRDPIARRWQHMYASDVPIAVVTTLKPFWYFAGTSQSTHGSPHDYDAQVPIVFAGAGIRPGRNQEFVRTVDIAPTLAALLGVPPLEKLDGVVLKSALREASP